MPLTTNMGLTTWDLTDLFDHNELIANWTAVDIHDHSSGKGIQIGAAGIADGAIATAKIANSAVSTAKIANDAITSGKILDGTITQGDLATGLFVPIGGILPYGGATAPTNFLLCDGTSYSRTTYATLFGILGGSSSPYGLPDGSTFRVPDFQGRVGIGKGGHADVDALGDNEGIVLASQNTRTPKHKHTVTDPGHSHGGATGSTDPPNHDHNLQYAGAGTGSSGATRISEVGTGGATAVTGTRNQSEAHTHTISSGTTGLTVGNASGPTETPPYIVVQYIIRAL